MNRLEKGFQDHPKNEIYQEKVRVYLSGKSAYLPYKPDEEDDFVFFSKIQRLVNLGYKYNGIKFSLRGIRCQLELPENKT